MAYTEITPVKLTGVVGKSYVICKDQEATHWLIDIGFDGNSVS